MGTYTTNYNLFMPTVGEQGWGDLVNGNFSTIDTTMKGLDTRLTAVENEVNGNLSCTSVTTSGTITSTGLITANGGVAGGAISGTTGTFSGAVTGTKFTRTTNFSVTSSAPSVSSAYALGSIYTCILPVREKPYNGTVALRKQSQSTTPTIRYITSLSATSANTITFSSTPSETKTITLSNAQCLYISDITSYVGVGSITLT